MTVTLRLGFLPLVDAAPLIIAEALGFAEEEGLALDLVAAPSWSALRDLLAFGEVTAAQMLAPVPVALALGLGSPARFDVLSVLNLNGNAIGVSTGLAARMRDHDFALCNARDAGVALLAAAGQRLRIGVPFAFSMHTELVRYWLEGLGPTLPASLQIVTVPPPLMPDALAAGEVDAFCVGEPRGSVAVDRGAGVLLLPTSAIWAAAPEKVLAARAGWAEAEPDLAGRLIRALWRAGRWLGNPANLTVAGEVLATRLGVPADLIERSLTGRLVINLDGAERVVPGFLRFDGAATGFPWRSQAAWIGARLARRHGLNPMQAQILAAGVFRSDLYRLHLGPAGADLPAASAKVEGSLAQPTPVASSRGKLILPPDQFYDAQVFDPGLVG
ncbi:MAG: ABC transporter substrate-binding protein [Tabrizicola sp.]|uniref:ABC transporter substrate-binding protein n=1 Tax=Tabrizicola sp. TaxID=2005166 RepID=UPI002ABC8434|nr:ABC transporter substrate-binding protein [Tabrizicola sp.]MDZ4086369.1 ABC transporter substrate-binding protein [Tabrizicola sp.]